jgi:glycosyltransferase involved in cell wall biosynthesis
MVPLVSILIPAYDAEKWIAETIRSAIFQTWPNKEIIVVDDGSTDGTLSIARRFESGSVKIISQPNQGASSARNTALGLSQGEYIQWLDADDLLAPDKVAKQMEVAACASKRMLLSSAWGAFLYRPAKARFSPTPLWADLSPVEWLLLMMGENLYMQTATWLASRELTEAAGPWDTRLLGDDDGEYFCRVLLASSGVRFVPYAKVYYRITDSGRLSYIARSNKKMEAHLLSRQLQIGYLRSLEDNGRVRAACLKYLQTSFINFYPERMPLVRKSQQLAAMLGGQLEIPKLPWKYFWIQKLFGLAVAKRVRQRWNQYKSSVMRSWDKALFRLEGGTHGREK